MVMNNKILYTLLAIILISVIVALIIFSIKSEKQKNEVTDISSVSEGGEEFNSDHLSNFNFSIVNMNEEVINYIKDISKFKNSMKQFLYKNGNVDCSEAKYISYELDDNIITIKFKLNDSKESRLIAKVNLQTEVCEFIVY